MPRGTVLMKCPRCQYENPIQAKFCLECGAPLAPVCAKCQTRLPASAKFCLECGEPIAGQAPASPSPDTYTPKHLADKILTSKSALEGERKLVTVLFADLKGSMELLSDRDPEEARKILDPVLEIMMEAVHRYEGTVNQVMGDGIMALFGAPLAHEDHAVRACYAALRMQATLRRYAESLRKDYGLNVGIRVGINSGEVVVRAIGSDLRMDYTAVGQTTHLAARMEQMAHPGATLLTRETLALAEGFVRVSALGPLAVKGLMAPIDVYELVEPGTAQSRLQAATVRGLSRFVGRNLEFAQLIRALDQARQGRGQVVAIVGEPGVGKSRLTLELTHSHHLDGWLILKAGALSYGKATSYLPLVQLLKSYFGIGDHDAGREIRERLSSKILSLDHALGATLPALFALLDAQDDDPQWRTLDASQRRQLMLDAVRALLLREAQVQPLLVIFEDLHWIDTESQAFLEILVETLPTARLLLLVNYRPEYQHGWASKTYYTQFLLDALPGDSANELLLSLLGPDVSIEPLIPLLIARTGGNPLFVEESVRALIEAHALVGERGAYRLTRSVETVDIPATVQTILASRIDRLELAYKELLQTASVLGTDVPLAPLSAIADLTETDLRQGLARLQAAEFLYEKCLFPEPEYTFKHALTHEVAYGSLLHDRRRRLHARVAEALELLYANRLAEHTERLAHHTFKGEVWEKAAQYALQAGDRAAERSGVREAARYGEQGLDALVHVPPTTLTLELAFHLRNLVYHRYFALGATEQVVPWAKESVAIAEKFGDKRSLAGAKNNLANALWFTCQNAQALALAEEAQNLAEAIGDTKTRVTAALDVGQISRTMGDFRRGADVLARAAALLSGNLARDRLDRAFYPFVTLRTNLAGCLAELGEFLPAMTAAREAMSFTESVQQPGTLVTALVGLAVPLLIRGEFLAAIPYLERAAGISRQSYSSMYPSCAARLGQAYAMDARHGEAHVLLAEALTLVRNISPRNEIGVMLCVIEGYMLAGRHQEALAIARQAIDLARTRCERGSEARAFWLLAKLASGSETPNLQMAEENYGKALKLARELGMHPIVAHCRLGLGRHDQRLDRCERAREHLIAATTMYREMGMTYWLQQTERESRQQQR
jgi:class 3 adenylate cyclase/tetratricopeptide (TPR) repeat protein